MSHSEEPNAEANSNPTPESASLPPSEPLKLTGKFALFGPVLAGFLNVIGGLWVAVFGAVSWRSPAWLRHLVRFMRQKPKQTMGLIALLAVLGAGGWWGYFWLQNRPKPIEPPRIQVSVTAPAVTDYSQTPITINPLVVEFSASVAPIALVGKPVKTGVELSPPVAGQWVWQSDKALIFTPAADWPVGQKYTLTLNPKTAITAGVLLAKTEFTFSTTAFIATMQSSEFYQDPQDPLKKSAIFGVSFNYPVDPKTFEQAVTLAMLEPDPKIKNTLLAGPPQKFTVTYDQRFLNAFVHSAPLSLPQDTQHMRFTLAKEVKSVRGGAGLPQPLQNSVQIPGLYSLAINDATVTLVENAQFEPSQTLILGTTAPVTGKDLGGKVKAWLLPENGPNGQTYYGWSPSQVSEAVLKHSEGLKLAVQPTERDYESVHGFKFTAPPERYIFVQVNQGLNGFGGYVLGKPVNYVLQVPPYPQMLKFMGQGSLLSMSGDHRISVVARNVPGMRVSIAQVLPTQIQHLVAFNQGSFARPALRIAPDHLVQRFIQTEPLPDADPTKAVYSGVDLSDYLGSGTKRKRGVFLVRVSAWDPAHPDDSANYSDQNNPFDANSYIDEQAIGDARLIVVTDLGLLVKKSLDGSRDVFVQSIRTGQPVADTLVKVIAENGETLLSDTTGADGHVHFPTLDGFKREQKPVMFSVYHTDQPTADSGNMGGTDFSFLPIGGSDRALNYSRFDVGGAPSAESAGELSAYLFSDRGLYRPGDEFHIGLIVRSASWQQNIAGVPLKVELVDPRGITVTKERISPDHSGFMQWHYTPSETAPTGAWTVNLYLVNKDDDNTLLGSTTVQIKEFEPDQTRVTARLQPAVATGWIKPNDIHALIQADTLYGTPADNRRVTATLTLRPAFPSFAAFADYHFYDPERAKEGYTETLQEQSTDAQGAANFALNLSSFAPATYALRFYAQVFEPNSGRNVSAAASALVSNADYLIGLKTEGALDFIQRDAVQKIHLVAIDPKLQSIGVSNLKTVILDRQYVSVLTRQDSGVYKYESKLKETPMDSQPLTIAAGGTEFTLPTAQPGSYALVIESSAGKQLNRIDFVVAGASNVSRSLERNAELQLALNKKDYAPGDTIDVAIRAPYPGSGLITIERDKVYAWAWFHSDTASSVQHITLPKDFEGNGYINVQFVRDPASSAVYMSPLSYGVVPFSVDLGAHKAPISLTVPALIKPGQTLDMTVSTPEPTDVVVFAVDQGILQVANYTLEDPLNYFFRKRMLQVSTNQILDLILPSFAQLTNMATTGGDEDSLRQQQLNPFKRKHERPVAYWSGITSIKGSHTFQYTVPDSFNGALKVMVMAVTPEKIGIAQADTTVRGDFVLSPNLPVAVAPGDEFDASVNVVNNLPPDVEKSDATKSDASLPIRVQLDAGRAFEVLNDPVQTIDLSAGKSGVVNFKLRALADLGSAPVQFTASYQQATARRSVEISVRPAVPFQTDLSVGQVKAGKPVTVAPLRDLFPARSESRAAVSFLPLVMMRGLSAYLQNYSNYCTEQTISAATPALITSAQPEFALNAADAARAPSVVSRAIATLRNRQNSEGGFGVWTATPEADPFVSVYAVQFLMLARQAGIAVPNDMLNQGLNYLRSLAANDALANLGELRARAFAIYLLTESGQVTTNLIASVQQRLQEKYPADWPTDTAAVYLASSYHLLKQDREANKLIQAPIAVLSKPRPASLPWSYAYYYDPLIFDGNALYLLQRNFPLQAAQLPVETITRMVQAIAQGRYNTLSAAMSMLALSGSAGEKIKPDGLTLTQSDGKKAVAPDNTIPAKPFGTVKGAILSGDIALQSTSVTFSNESKDPALAVAWYALAQSGYDRIEPTKTIKDGLEIEREYTDEAGKPITTVELGQTIDVHINLRALGDRAVGDVAVVDILPGGFEIVANPPPAPPSDQNSAHSAATGNDSGNNSGDATVEHGDELSSEVTASTDPLAQPGSNMMVSYVEPREDRVLIYATANRDVQQYIYRIRATNTGKFMIPPAYAASMYDRSLHAYTPGRGTLQVMPPATIPESSAVRAKAKVQP
ncbi:MAG: alpha-2-macroglobulin [Halothiobacillus sp.]